MGPNYCSKNNNLRRSKLRCGCQREGVSSQIFSPKGLFFMDLNFFQDLFISCLKVLVGAGTKNKPLMKTGNSSSLKVWLGRL